MNYRLFSGCPEEPRERWTSTSSNSAGTRGQTSVSVQSPAHICVQRDSNVSHIGRPVRWWLTAHPLFNTLIYQDGTKYWDTLVMQFSFFFFFTVHTLKFSQLWNWNIPFRRMNYFPILLFPVNRGSVVLIAFIITEKKYEYMDCYEKRILKCELIMKEVGFFQLFALMSCKRSTARLGSWLEIEYGSTWSSQQHKAGTTQWPLERSNVPHDQSSSRTMAEAHQPHLRLSYINKVSSSLSVWGVENTCNRNKTAKRPTTNRRLLIVRGQGPKHIETIITACVFMFTAVVGYSNNYQPNCIQA